MAAVMPVPAQSRAMFPVLPGISGSINTICNGSNTSELEENPQEAESH